MKEIKQNNDQHIFLKWKKQSESSDWKQRTSKIDKFNMNQQSIVQINKLKIYNLKYEGWKKKSEDLNSIFSQYKINLTAVRATNQKLPIASNI